jgi:hypothetical protein
MSVPINSNDKYPLIRILLPIGMLDFIEEPISLEEKDYILKRDAAFFNKLLILIGVPIERLHQAKILAQCVPFGIIFTANNGMQPTALRAAADAGSCPATVSS